MCDAVLTRNYCKGRYIHGLMFQFTFVLRKNEDTANVICSIIRNCLRFTIFQFSDLKCRECFAPHPGVVLAGGGTSCSFAHVVRSILCCQNLFEKISTLGAQSCFETTFSKVLPTWLCEHFWRCFAHFQRTGTGHCGQIFSVASLTQNLSSNRWK